jgi:aryl-alcohol dehydrogenase-like predicted oxidoreductase
LQRLRSVGERYHKLPCQVAIRWVLDVGSVRCAIVGAKSPAQVDQNVEAVGWRLTPEDWHFLAGQQLTHAEAHPVDCVLANKGKEDSAH